MESTRKIRYWTLQTLYLKVYRHYRHDILSYVDITDIIHITSIIYYSDINKYILKWKIYLCILSFVWKPGSYLNPVSDKKWTRSKNQISRPKNVAISLMIFERQCWSDSFSYKKQECAGPCHRWPLKSIHCTKNDVFH